MTLPVENPAVYTDLKGLAALKNSAKSQDPKALREAARQFESLFARMMIKSMRDASFGDKLLGSDQQDFYQGMFDDQLAVELSRGKGLGLADMLVQQLTRAGLAPTGETAAQNPAAPATKPTNFLNPLGAPTDSSARAKALAFLSSLSSPPDFNVPELDTGSAAVGSLDSITAKVDAALAAARADGTAKPNGPTQWPADSPQDFVRELWPVAQRAGRELGIDPRHILAQAALETGWGRAVPTDVEGKPTFNFFGIKAGSRWSGASVPVRTLEFEDGIPVQRRERFRAYGSADECFRDYVALLRDNPRYASALNTGGDVKAFATALQRGGYASDPNYAQKISAIAQNLTISNDDLKSVGAAPMTSTPEPL